MSSNLTTLNPTNQNQDQADAAVLQHYAEYADVYILAAVARSRAFWKAWSSIICLEPPKVSVPGKPALPVHCDDFTDPLNNALYVAIHQTQLLEASTGVEIVSASLVQHSLQTMIKRGLMLSETELPVALQRVQVICGAGLPDDFLVVANRIVRPWLMSRRGTRLNAKLASTRIGLAAVREELNKVVAHVDSGTIKDNAVAIGQDMELRKVELRHSYEAVSVGMCKLMGGGFRKGEATLVIAAQAVGKTIHAMQCTSDLFLKHKLKVLAITTEQLADDLELRHIARECSINFSKLADGFDISRLNPEEIAAYRSYKAHVAAARAAGGEVLTLHWEKSPIGLHTKLEELIQRYGSQLGGLDAITLDWIGGGMSMTDSAASNFRFFMQMLGDVFCEVVRRYDLIGVAYSQARAVTKEGYDNLYVCAENLQECKSLGNNFTNVLGMSGMRDMEADISQPGQQQTFKPVQNYFLSKARKGTGGTCKFSRAKYNYQKLYDLA